MQTTIITRDNQTVTLTHREPISESELKEITAMDLRRLFHVGWVNGFRREENN